MLEITQRASQSLKIAFVHDHPFDEIGGVQIATLNLAKALVKFGHKVILVNPGATRSSRFVANEIEVRTANAASDLEEILRDADAIQINLTFSLNDLATMSIRHLTEIGRPFVLSIRTYPTILVHSKQLHEPQKFMYRRKIIKKALESGLCRPVAPTVAAADSYKCLGYSGSFEVVRNFVRAPLQSSTVPWELRENDFIFVGRLSNYKNVGDFVIGLSMMNETRNFKAKIVGTGENLGSLIALAKGLGLERKLEFCGELSHHSTLEMISSSRILVNTSLTELCPNVLVEAALRNVSLVASDIPAHRALSEDGIAMRLYSSGDPKKMSEQIDEVLSKPEHQQLEANQEKARADFSSQALLEKYDEIYMNQTYGRE